MAVSSDERLASRFGLNGLNRLQRRMSVLQAETVSSKKLISTKPVTARRPEHDQDLP
jgi:hypothetical protein